MTRRCTTRQGFVILELAVALFVMGVLTYLVARMVTDYTRTRDHYAWREAAAWAAEAQVQRLLAGAALESQPPAGTLSKPITLTQHVAPGEGVWAGFDLVTVTATVQRDYAKPIQASARGYVFREVQR